MKSSKVERVRIAVLACIVLVYSDFNWAVDILPGDVIPLPDGADALAIYYLYGHSDEYSTLGQTFKKDTSLDTQAVAIRGVHSFKIGDLRAQANIILPYGTVAHGEIGGSKLNDAEGVGDIQLSLQVWPLSDFERGTQIGISGLVKVPTGSYNDKHSVNIGENRWSGNLIFAGSQRIAKDWSVEGYLDVLTYGKNNNAGFNGDQTLKQRDTYEGQFYLVHNFSQATSVSVGYAIYSGGEVSIDGESTGARTKSQQARFALNQFLSKTSLLTLQVAHDYSVSGGFRQDVGVTMRLGYLF